MKVHRTVKIRCNSQAKEKASQVYTGSPTLSTNSSYIWASGKEDKKVI